MRDQNAAFDATTQRSRPYPRGSAWSGAVAILALALTLGAASAQPLAGTFRGVSDAGPTTVVLERRGDTLVGRLEAPGLRFDFEGEVSGGVGLGWVRTELGTAGFEAHVQGDTLGLYLYELDAAGGAVAGSVVELILQRVIVEPAPSPPAPVPGGIADGSAPAGGSPVIARGAFADLSEDAALAFLEALEFVFAEIGVPYTFPDAERRAALEALAAGYPSATREEQLLLADARAIWLRVGANWHGADLAERREFALGVLALAYGEDLVEQWIGATAGAPAGAGGGAGGCATFEACAGAYVGEQSWTDTFNPQGCWAAAGCQGYDVDTGTFDYGDGY